MFIYLDISTEKPVIKLFDDNALVIGAKELSSNSNLTGELLSSINELLSDKRDRVKGLFINTGEKSYTGMRIGMTSINFTILLISIVLRIMPSFSPRQ